MKEDVGTGWRDIETAPMEREVLVAMVCKSSGQHWVTAATQEREGQWFNVNDGRMFPYAWMPLPAPPTKGTSR